MRGEPFALAGVKVALTRKATQAHLQPGEDASKLIQFIRLQPTNRHRIAKAGPLLAGIQIWTDEFETQ